MFGADYILQKIISIPLILIAMVGHELAHGYVSTWLGDPTPKRYGRLSINPLNHIDPIGALLMLIAGFGWAKPVMINPQYYKNRKWGTALVSLAGPLANLCMAFLSLLIYVVFLLICANTGLGAFVSESVYNWAGTIAMLLASYNLSFMLFNLIPIPPLDGSKVLGAFLPDRIYYRMLNLERYYTLILFIVIFLLSRLGVFSTVIGGGISLILDGMLRLFSIFF